MLKGGTGSGGGKNIAAPWGNTAVVTEAGRGERRAARKKIRGTFSTVSTVPI